ncbi:hypothetical protein N7456_009435 [Penicillium angulare]|uniref:Uncharacterized protein n=1 Tax=Penicillium angulare TaxID=116970 RepID=A0A9W9F4W6_9EURO|nr:hypothetical protein N7456_009435 [Penicillium angulare]
MPSTITNGRAPAMRTRNRAIFSIAAVLAGTWMMFRAQSPTMRDVLISDDDIKKMNGLHPGSQTARPTVVEKR